MGLPACTKTPTPLPGNGEDGYCEDVCFIKIDSKQIFDLYDTFNEKIRKDLQDDYDCKKINGATFAATWAQMMPSIVNSIMQSIVTVQNKETHTDKLVKYAQIDEIRAKSCRDDCLAESECDLKKEQTDKVKYETDTLLPTQNSLSIRQREGFDDNVNQKLFEAQMNSWAMMFSSGLLEDVPTIISSNEVSALYYRLLK